MGPSLDSSLDSSLSPFIMKSIRGMPAFKHHVTGQGAHTLNERLASRKHLTQEGVVLVIPLKYSME